MSHWGLEPTSVLCLVFQSDPLPSELSQPLLVHAPMHRQLSFEPVTQLQSSVLNSFLTQPSWPPQQLTVTRHEKVQENCTFFNKSHPRNMMASE